MLKTNEQFIQEVYELVGDEYIFIEDYVHSQTKIEVVHNTCGNRYEVRPGDFIYGVGRCPRCRSTSRSSSRGASRWADETYKAKVNELVGDEYTFLGSYKGSQTKIEVIHNTCGNKYEVRPGDFIYGVGRCPRCSEYNESKGERKIADYLDKQGIHFEREKTFSDLKVINSLRYDFAIYHIGELLTLIEYDGEQHFVAVDYFGGEEQLLKTQEYDRIKNEYARQNNIPLLRIPYNKYDSIEEIIDRYLSDHF